MAHSHPAKAPLTGLPERSPLIHCSRQIHRLGLMARAVLLTACISWSLNTRNAKLLLVIAWAYVLGVMNAAFWGHFEGHLRGVVICDNDPAEVGAIVGKGVIWLIALICLVVSSISMWVGEPNRRAA